MQWRNGGDNLSDQHGGVVHTTMLHAREEILYIIKAVSYCDTNSAHQLSADERDIVEAPGPRPPLGDDYLSRFTTIAGHKKMYATTRARLQYARCRKPIEDSSKATSLRLNCLKHSMIDGINIDDQAHHGRYNFNEGATNGVKDQALISRDSFICESKTKSHVMYR